MFNWFNSWLTYAPNTSEENNNASQQGNDSNEQNESISISCDSDNISIKCDIKYTVPEPPLHLSPPIFNINTRKLDNKKNNNIKDEFTGPARNAPNNGKNIKVVFETRSSHMIIITESDIKNVLSGLRKTKINENPPATELKPLEKELRGVFECGNQKYFDSIRMKRQNNK